MMKKKILALILMVVTASAAFAGDDPTKPEIANPPKGDGPQSTNKPAAPQAPVPVVKSIIVNIATAQDPNLPAGMESDPRHMSLMTEDVSSVEVSVVDDGGRACFTIVNWDAHYVIAYIELQKRSTGAVLRPFCQGANTWVGYANNADGDWRMKIVMASGDTYYGEFSVSCGMIWSN